MDHLEGRGVACQRPREGPKLPISYILQYIRYPIYPLSYIRRIQRFYIRLNRCTADFYLPGTFESRRVP